MIMSPSQLVLRALACRSGPACAAAIRSSGLSRGFSRVAIAATTRRVGGAMVKPSLGSSASFSVGAVRRAGKESSLGKEDRAEEVERAKHEQLREQKEGKGQWKDELASDSESFVKADRGEFNANEETIKKLQEETEKMAKKSR